MQGAIYVNLKQNAVSRAMYLSTPLCTINTHFLFNQYQLKWENLTLR
ncbi:MAG: hypothetical protein RLZZ321_1119 [Bacteroidota bacterium]|jgi:hypothetical protein